MIFCLSLRIHFQLAEAKSTVTNRVCNAHKECNVNWGDSVNCIAKHSWSVIHTNWFTVAVNMLSSLYMQCGHWNSIM